MIAPVWLKNLIPNHNIQRLTHWGRVTHICISKQTIIGSDNGLSPGRHQAIIWTNAGILLIGTLGTNFSEILIENRIISFKKMGLKVSSVKWRPFCLGLNVLSVNHVLNFWDVLYHSNIPWGLTHCDVIWQHRSGTILAQTMAWCLIAPSHFPEPILTVRSCGIDGNFTGKA